MVLFSEKGAGAPISPPAQAAGPADVGFPSLLRNSALPSCCIASADVVADLWPGPPPGPSVDAETPLGHAVSVAPGTTRPGCPNCWRRRSEGCSHSWLSPWKFPATSEQQAGWPPAGPPSTAPSCPGSPSCRELALRLCFLRGCGGSGHPCSPCPGLEVPPQGRNHPEG